MRSRTLRLPANDCTILRAAKRSFGEFALPVMSIVSSLMLSEMFVLLSEGSRRSAASILARSSLALGCTGLSAPALAFLSVEVNGFAAGAVFVAPAADSGFSISAGFG